MNDLENLYESLIELISEMMSSTIALAPYPVTPVSTQKSKGQKEGNAMYKHKYKKMGIRRQHNV